MKWFLCLLLLQVTFCLEGCDKMIQVNDFRTIYRSNLSVSRQIRTICIVTPKQDAAQMLSISFLPTRCVNYQDDSWPQNHPLDNQLSIYKVKVTRDHCMTIRQSQEQFVVSLKEAIRLSPNVAFDRSVPTYFAIAIFLSFAIFLGLVQELKKSKLLRPQSQYDFKL